MPGRPALNPRVPDSLTLEDSPGEESAHVQSHSHTAQSSKVWPPRCSLLTVPSNVRATTGRPLVGELSTQQAAIAVHVQAQSLCAKEAEWERVRQAVTGSHHGTPLSTGDRDRRSGI